MRELRGNDLGGLECGSNRAASLAAMARHPCHQLSENKQQDFVRLGVCEEGVEGGGSESDGLDGCCGKLAL